MEGERTMKRFCIAVLTIAWCLLCVSCVAQDASEQTDDGTVVGQTYVSEEIGWSIVIPENWTALIVSATLMAMSSAESAHRAPG